MGRIDKFFDTYAKRLSFALFFIGSYYGFCLVNNFLLGSKMLAVKSLQELITLSSNELLYKTFLGQIVLNYLNTQANIPLSLVNAIGVIRVIIFAFLLVFLFSKLPKTLKGMKLINIVGTMLMITGYVFVLGFTYLATKSTTTDMALTNMNNAGLSLMIASGIELAYLLFGIFVLLFKNIKTKEN